MGNSCCWGKKPTSAARDVALDFVEARDLETIQSMLYPRGPITDIDITDGKGWTCLMHQCRNGNDKAVKFLLDHAPPANPNILSDSTGLNERDTALLCALTGNYPSIIKLLLEAGAVRITNLYGSENVVTIAKSKFAEQHECVTILETYFPKTMQTLEIEAEEQRLADMREARAETRKREEAKRQEDERRLEEVRRQEEEDLRLAKQMAARKYLDKVADARAKAEAIRLALEVKTREGNAEIERKAKEAMAKAEIDRKTQEHALKLASDKALADEQLRLLREREEREKRAKEAREKEEREQKAKEHAVKLAREKAEADRIALEAEIRKEEAVRLALEVKTREGNAEIERKAKEAMAKAEIDRKTQEHALKLASDKALADEQLRLLREREEREKRAKEARDAAEAERIEKERVLKEEFNCTICYESKLLSNSIICSSGQIHRICQECFWSDTQNQINEGKFPSRSRKIVCSQCLFEKRILPFVPYEDDLAMQYICRDKRTLEIHQRAIVNCVRSETESKAEAEKVAMRLKHEHELMQLKIIAEPDFLKKMEASVALHSHRIFNEIIVTKCPHCDLAFADWTNCFAVGHTVQYIEKGKPKEAGCHLFFCGWCLEKFPDTILAHRHVPICPKSLRPGAVYGQVGDFERVEATMRKEKVEKYLANLRSSGEVNAPLMDMLLRSIQKGLSDINVVLDSGNIEAARGRI